MLSKVAANEARHFAFSFYVRISKIALWNVKRCLFRAIKEEIQTIYRNCYTQWRINTRRARGKEMFWAGHNMGPTPAMP